MNLVNQLALTHHDHLQGQDEVKPKLHSLALFDDMYAYYNCSRVYYSYFGEIPNILLLKHVSPEQVVHWMESRYAADIAAQHYRKVSNGKGKGFTKCNVIFVLRSQVIVGIEGDHSIRIYFTEPSEALAKTLANELESFIEQTPKHNMSIVIDKGNGLELSNYLLKRPKINLATHYNDDMLPVHEALVKRLNQKGKCGLVLLHGASGTGKSTYIRSLVHKLKKKVIFLPSKFANTLDAPDVTNMLCQNPGSIIVIEDAESLLSCRESGYNSNLSMLLNITDGVLGEALGIHVIATFNTKLNKIDKALLRKGRLVARYEFRALAVEKANALLAKQGITETASHALPLADIFHFPDPSFHFRDESKSLGFRQKT